MRPWSRSGPALLWLAAALVGCDGNPPSHSGSPPTVAVNPNMPQVTLEVPGMT